jgi:hypothetical protein
LCRGCSIIGSKFKDLKQLLTELRTHAHHSRPDKTPFVKLYEAIRSAPDEAAKQKATDAMFQAVRDLGDAQVREVEAYMNGVRAVFTDRQWRILNYQEPPPNGS